MHYCEGIVANKAVTESFSTHQLTAAYYQLGLLASACKNSIVILCNTEELSTKLDLALICSELRTIVREAKAFDQLNFNKYLYAKLWWRLMACTIVSLVKFAQTSSLSY